jgi:hypothetical protein
MKTINIQLELTEQEAKEFAMFIKRFDYTEIRNAIRDGDSELAGNIRKTIEKILKSFQDVGVSYTRPVDAVKFSSGLIRKEK